MGANRHNPGVHLFPRNGARLAPRQLAAPLRSCVPSQSRKGSAHPRPARVWRSHGSHRACPQRLLAEAQCGRQEAQNGQEERESHLVRAPRVSLPTERGPIRTAREKRRRRPRDRHRFPGLPTATSARRSGVGPQLALSCDLSAGRPVRLRLEPLSGGMQRSPSDSR
jgi:hypothetical protein